MTFRARPGLMRAVPNALSIGRIVLAIAFPLLPAHWHLVVVFIAGVSDAADGYIARRFGAMSVAGGLLDAVADKAFVLSALLTFAFSDVIEWWHVGLLVLRDLAVVLTAGYAMMLGEWASFRRMKPVPLGKLTTMLIFAWFVVLTAGLDVLVVPLVPAAGACSALAALHYLFRFGNALRQRRATAS